MALFVDPHMISELRWKLRDGSVVVVGTNGKTTVTNLLADVVEASGRSVLCNRTGANLDSGIASALLQGKPADWGVLECDELWLAKVLPELRATYVLLLNLFRDQLDRCGEIDRIQDSIVGALQSSPETVLVYNADDPLCAFIARRVEEERAAQIAAGGDVPSFRSVAFSVSESMNLEQNVVADATMCQACSHMFRYEYRQYGQLGAYECPECGFARPAFDFAASDVRFGECGLSFDVAKGESEGVEAPSTRRLEEGCAAGDREILRAEQGSVRPCEQAAPQGDAARFLASARNDAGAGGLGGARNDAGDGRDSDRNDAGGGRDSDRNDGAGNVISSDSEKSSHPAGRAMNETVTLHARLAGSYMVYNLLAVYSAATLVGCSAESVQKAITAFDPKNGRLQEYFVDGRRTLLNLAKNPTGFNQNLRIVAEGEGPRGVAFFINDQIVDGRDISWIWDIDFEELVAQPGFVVFAGGSRRNDLQVRLKYAGVKAQLVDGVEEVFASLASLSTSGKLPADAPVYAVANYSALPPVKAKLDQMQEADRDASRRLEGGCEAGDREILRAEQGSVRPCEQAAPQGDAARFLASARNDADDGRDSARNDDAAGSFKGTQNDAGGASSSDSTCASASPVVVAHVLPDLLNLYGDGGNVRILEQRLRWRGIPVEVRKLHYGDSIDFADVDLVVLGGGPDREQKLATEELDAVRGKFAEYIDEGGPLLAICGGFQILGKTWLLGDDEVPGLGIVDIETRRPGTSADRLVDNVALKSSIAEAPVVGYENHAGRTYLGSGVVPFGTVVSKVGQGNNDGDGQPADGILEGNILGTYLHGTLLAKNPEVADWLLAKALDRHAGRTGEVAFELVALDDSEELAANAFMARKLI